MSVRLISNKKHNINNIELLILHIHDKISIFVVKIKLMRTIQIQIPDSVDMNEYDFSMFIAAKLYNEAKLSSGQAAQIVGLSKRAFIEMLGIYGVSVFGNSIADLHSDIANA